MISSARLRVWLAPWAGVIALMATLSTQVQAQTQVSGEIVANTYWKQSGAPYVVNGQLTVRGGALLTIEAGSTVYMSSGSSIRVEAGGIQAIGSSAQPIRVLSDKSRQGLAAAPGDWKQWIFGSGTANTRLDYVQFRHGQGLQVTGSSPIFNHLDIRDQQGAAISIDLTASPSGVGNYASGNGINGIVVPGGDVSGSVRWGLRGIPYVVTSGTVSVGVSPVLSGVSPATVEQGQTQTLTLSGLRLDGMTQVASDTDGLRFSPFSGGTSTQAFVQVQTSAVAPTGQVTLRVQVDAGEIVFPNALTVTPPLPDISGLDPSVVLAGGGVTDIAVSGRNFLSTSEVLFNSAAVPTTFVSTTQLRAKLPSQPGAAVLQAQVRTPDSTRPGQHLLSHPVPLKVEAPVPPVVSVEPTPIALPPDGKPRDITIRLSKADYRDNVLNLSVSDVSKATVTPASLLIPAGQTVAKITMVPKVAGTANFVIDSAHLPRLSVPLFITTDFRGASTAYASPVGVMLHSNSPDTTVPVTVSNANVGVAVGGVLTQVSPRAWPLGGSTTLVIRGVVIPNGARVSLLPAAGIEVATPTLNAAGDALSVVLSTASDAPLGVRKLLVQGADGKELVFSDPAQSVIEVMTGPPSIDSITPMFGERATTLKLMVQGRHLQRGQLQLLPSSGLRLDAAPVVSVDGTQLTALVDISADAPLGERAVQVVTPAGATTTAASEKNTFKVVSSVRGAITPVASPLVGVLVGDNARTAPASSSTSVVGVLLGSGIAQLSPNAAVVGAETIITARGIGLKGVAAVSLTPATGVSIGSLSVNEAGTELRFAVAVEAGASTGPRRLSFIASNGLPLTFSRPTDASFLISVPLPELASVHPQVLLAGQGSAVKVTVRGRNLVNVTGARIEPTQGVMVTGPFETNADGSVLSFSVMTVAEAAPGTRAVVVSSAAGETTTALHAGNMVRVAKQLGASYSDLLSPMVGVVLGSSDTSSRSFDQTQTSATVGVQLGVLPSVPRMDFVSSRAVGLVLGPVAQSMTPGGWLQGASGEIVVTGHELGAVTNVSVSPPTGLLLGAPSASDGGTRWVIPISVAPDAPQVLRRLSLSTSSGSLVSFAEGATATFGIGGPLPSLKSVSPLVLERGKGTVLTVRGSNLKGVLRVRFEPDSGVRVADQFIRWSQDELGELLTLPVVVDANTSLGNRVLRLEVHGATTSGESTPSNTVNVSAPQ